MTSKKYYYYLIPNEGHFGKSGKNLILDPKCMCCEFV